MDKALKQRLVGASVLVALAVIVLPMLLGGQPDSAGESRSIDLPPKPQELSFETRRFPIGDQDAGQPSVLERPAQQDRLPAPVEETDSSPVPGSDDAPAESDSETASDSGPAATAAVEQSPVQELGADESPAQTIPSEAGDTVTPPQTAPATATGRYLVQVASFSSSGNANQLAASLRENGMPVLLDTVDATAGRLHRVRLGPYAERQEADQAIVTLNTKFPGVEGPRVVDSRPDETALVSDPSDPLIRWVVQVGSYGDSSNAESQVYRLRDAGYRASSAAVSSSSGTAYKVRVGPVIDRQEAVQLAASIKSDLGLDGLVMAAD